MTNEAATAVHLRDIPSIEEVINERRRAQDRERPGEVYFISYGEGEAIKIGFTSNFSYRFQGLQTCCPHELIVLAKVPGGMGLELDYHERFREHRIRGEWFEPHPDILAEIDRLQTKSSEHG